MGNLEFGSQALWRNRILGYPIVTIDSSIRNGFVLILIPGISNHPKSSLFTDRELTGVDLLVPLPEKYTWDQIDALRSILRD